jgi:hypothetical protein
MLIILALAPLLLAWYVNSYYPRGMCEPTDAEVIQAVIDSGQRVPSEPYDIVKQCTVSYADPVRTVPLLGPVVLHREFYHCSITGLDSNRSVSVDVEYNTFVQVQEVDIFTRQRMELKRKVVDLKCFNADVSIGSFCRRAAVDL